MSDLVVHMSQQRETKCRFCAGRSLLFPVTGGDYSYFECDNCGRYRVSGTAEWVIERGGASPPETHKSISMTCGTRLLR